MTREDFVAICSDQTIDPEVALEDDGVIKILKQRVTTIHQDLMQQMELSAYLTNNF